MIAAIVVAVIVVAAAAYFLVLRKPSGGENAGAENVAPSFTISVSPSTLTIRRGDSDNLTISFQATPVQGGMPGQIVPSHLGYEVEGLPQGVQYSGAPGSLTTFVLTFTVADNTTTGSCPVRVVCTDIDRNLTSSDNFTLVITT